MLGTPELSRQQIEDFERDGFVIVPGLFAAQAGLLQQWAAELAALPEEPGRQWVYHEPSRLEPGVSLISRIEYISPFHEGFATLAKVLRAPVAQLLGEEAVLFKEKVNFKMPGGDGFRPHQDAQAGWERYADYFISVMVCIDEATIENGCLQFATGDYPRHSVVREWEPLTDEDMAGLEWRHYPTRPAASTSPPTTGPAPVTIWPATMPTSTAATRRTSSARRGRSMCFGCRGSYQLSVVSCQLSVFSCQFSGFRWSGLPPARPLPQPATGLLEKPSRALTGARCMERAAGCRRHPTENRKLTTDHRRPQPRAESHSSSSSSGSGRLMA